jgi:ATP adenylyltransferase
MEHLWSPWRSEYIDSFAVPAGKKNCFLCDAAHVESLDYSSLIVAKGMHCFVIMNRYPYNAGHIMVVPARHVAALHDLNTEEMMEMMEWVQHSVTVLRSLYKPHGFNIGMNLGQAAGAGVPDHIHMHIVPRWNGDTNFMSSIADLKVISSAMQKIWQQLSAEFRRLGAEDLHSGQQDQ